MKTQLILLAEPILVSDEEIKEGDNVLDNVYRIWTNIESCWLKPMKDAIKNQSIHYMPKGKIIAGIPELPSITYSHEALEVLEKKYGWVDVKKLAKLHFVDDYFWSDLSFIEGFKAAQSLNKKKFSEADVLSAIDLARLQGEESFLVKYGEEEILERISKPKVIDVEVEMNEIEYGHVDDYSKPHGFRFQPKITNNSIKLIKVL